MNPAAPVAVVKRKRPYVRPAPNPDLLDTLRACSVLGISRAQLFRMLKRDPTFPKPCRLGPRLLRWRRRELDAYLTRRAAA